MNSRVTEIDYLKGIALFFIAIMHVQIFGGLKFYDFEHFLELPNFGFDRELFAFLEIFSRGKFLNLFSITYGWSLALIIKRYEKKVIYKRLLMLLFLGLVHTYIIYLDILTTYALLSFVVLLIVSFSSAKLQNIIKLLFLLFVVLNVASDVLEYYDKDSVLLRSKNRAAYYQYPIYSMYKLQSRMSTGSVATIFYTNLWQLYNYLQIKLINFEYISTLINMFLGLYLFRSGVKTKFFKGSFFILATLIVFVRILVFPFQGWFGIEWTLLESCEGFDGSLRIVGYLFDLSMTYLWVCLFMLLFRFTGLRTLFSNYGRMSLSNYIIQSLLFYVFFYLMSNFANYSLSYLIVIALATNMILMLLSYLYFKKFSIGPLEFLVKRYSLFKV